MTNIEQAIWNEASEPLFDAFAKLISQKAAKLKKMQAIDLFEWNDKYGGDSANFKFRETQAAEYEIKILISVANYVNEMSEFYETDLIELTDKLQQKNDFIGEVASFIYHNHNL